MFFVHQDKEKFKFRVMLSTTIICGIILFNIMLIEPLKPNFNTPIGWCYSEYEIFGVNLHDGCDYPVDKLHWLDELEQCDMFYNSSVLRRKMHVYIDGGFGSLQRRICKGMITYDKELKVMVKEALYKMRS